jgi:hypothetical protein
VRLVQQTEAGEIALCQTQFAFDEVRLTPAGEGGEAGSENEQQPN